jgi:hypothetical protein
MSWNILKTSIAAAWLALAGVAQSDCPNQMAVAVPQNITYGASVTCAGLSWSVGGVSISSGTGCPLFVMITPAHETAAPSSKETKVKLVGMDPVRVFFFTCRSSYLIFIPLSSRCEFEREATAGSVMRLVTVGCNEPDA